MGEDEEIPPPDPAMMSKWQSLMSAQSDLFTQTIQRNAHLEARLATAEREVAIWQRALRASDAENTQLKAKLNNFEDRNALALCLVDGDGCIFDQSYLQLGKEGGRRAAARLTQEIVASVGFDVQLYTIIYYNRTGLGNALARDGLCNQKDLDLFVLGFNSAAPLFSMTDCGEGKESVDTKVRDVLRFFARFPQTKKIYFGGSHDGGYATILRSLQTEGLIDKTIILRGYTKMAHAIESLNIPVLTISGLFMEQRIATPLGIQSSPTKKQSPLFVTPSRRDVVVIAPVPEPGKFRAPNPKKLLHRHKPPPCNFYYLTTEGCRHGDNCRFAHNFNLTTTHKEQLRAELKQIACVKHGKCRDSPACFYNHDPAYIATHPDSVGAEVYDTLSPAPSPQVTQMARKTLHQRTLSFQSNDTDSTTDEYKVYPSPANQSPTLTGKQKLPEEEEAWFLYSRT